eukprot:TRINITY_DN29905_c0_g1_i1.p1 TRINITY_DN29905_c0_g1~~TRINITY_DN29905_c0_g1_i1.p1  ORF type:complete len:624 (-),score=133.15 TRINITY_DN29905_c0_g1_i1:51-1922(-)
MAASSSDNTESWLEDILQAERWAITSLLENKHKEMLKEFRSRARGSADYLGCSFDPMDSDPQSFFQVLGEPSPHIPPSHSISASSSPYVTPAAAADATIAISDVTLAGMSAGMRTPRPGDNADSEDVPYEAQDADLRVTRSTYSSSGNNRATTSTLSTASEASNIQSEEWNSSVPAPAQGNELVLQPRAPPSFKRTTLSHFSDTPSLSRQKSFLHEKGSTENGKVGCSSLKEFVEGPCFDSFFAFLIVANICATCAEYQYRGFDVAAEMGLPGAMAPEALWPGARDVFYWSDCIFLALFTLEMVLKLAGLRHRFFVDAWNYLDVAVVSLSTLNALESISIPLDPLVLRIMRLAKLLRLIKLAKTIKSFDSLYLLTASISSSAAALVWSAVLILVVQVLCAVVLSTFLLPFCVSDAPEADREEVYRYFGTFTKAMLSMFELTLGNWVPITRLLTEKVSEWYTIFLMTFQVVLGFAVIKVITGVFLTETMKVASMDDSIMLKTKQRAMRLHRKKMERLFSYADEDKDGTIAFPEFRDMFVHEEVRTWLAAMDLEAHTYEQVESLFRFLDRDNNGTLSIEELVKGVARLKGPAKNIDIAMMLADLASMKTSLASLEMEKTSSKGLT